MLQDKRLLRVFWYRRPHPGNFGDILTPLILSHYGYDVHHTMAEDADYVMVGSIAKIVLPRHTVLGSGVMTSNPMLCAEARWRWVRGPLTRDVVMRNGGECPEIYGDPAMLLPRIVPPAEKQYRMGIVPHYVDYQSVKEKYTEYPVINVLNADPIEVINQITACEQIISSSLHGIIVAHAYGIPAAWTKFDGKLAGDDTKFYDHYESIGLKAQLSSIDSPIFSIGKFDDIQIHSILEAGDF
jgi:pyruvyltransferase